jgi:serine/threonine-protein kinase
MADSPLLKESSTASEIAGWMAGEYRLGRKLGEGGFGAVYEAVHPLLKRRAAVKVLHRIAGAESDAVLRFVAEARAVNQIKNRHIIDIFSFGRLADGRHFYVMDLLEGEPLDRYLAREARCSVTDTIQLLRPIAEALDAAHAAGVVHRDLKPQNIFLSWDADGETVPKLLDFGMAKLLGESPVHTVSGTPLGTPLYMSPEQARGDLVDGRSDVYALGVLCHELLTGQLPITGENTIAVLMAHIIQKPPGVSQVCSELSPELDEAVLKMLEKKPELRPATASEALSELSFAARRAGSVVPPGPPRLSRPAPGSEPTRDHSRESADTTLQPFSPGSASWSKPDAARAELLGSAARPSPTRVAGWLWWALLAAFAALATVWLTRGWHGAPVAVASAPVPKVALPVLASKSSALAAPPSPSALAEPSGRDPGLTRPPKRLPGVASARPRIPADLESPF